MSPSEAKRLERESLRQKPNEKTAKKRLEVRKKLELKKAKRKNSAWIDILKKGTS